MTFSDFQAHSEPLFKQLNILKFKDSVILQNCLFVYDYFGGNLPSSFVSTFSRVDETHQTGTRSAETGLLSIPRYNSTTFGLKSIYKNCINSWNKMTTEINKIEKDKSKIKRKDVIDIDLYKMYSRSKLKRTLKSHFISKYNMEI